MELVSVIMSTFNTDEIMLKESIKSILNQTYKNIELIIVNDGSEKDDIDIIKSFSDNRIILINNTRNEGLAKSLNHAIDISKGVYIARMDSDDISYNNRIETQVKYLRDNKDIDIVGTFAKHFGSKDSLNITPLTNKDEVKIQLFTNATLIHPTVMIRKKFLDDFKIRYNSKFLCAQDFELWSRCVDKGSIEIIPEVLLLYRIHSKQISSEKRLLQKQYAEKILKKQLIKMNILHTEEELKMHLILSGIIDFDMKYIEGINSWIDKLIIQNKKISLYDEYLFENILKSKMFNLYLKNIHKKGNIIAHFKNNKDIINDITYYGVKKLFERLMLMVKFKYLRKYRFNHNQVFE